MRNYLLVLLSCFTFLANAQVPKGYVLIKDLPLFKKNFASASNAINSIKADFVQEKNLSVLSEKISSKGTFQFKKQSKARLEYISPFKYLFIINGNNVYIKDDQKTNTYSSKSNKAFENLNKLIIDCVQGTAIDNKNFTSVAYENDKQYLLVMTPVLKSFKDYFKKIHVYIDKSNYSVNRLEMTEVSGDNTVLIFSNKQFNLSLNEENFILK